MTKYNYFCGCCGHRFSHELPLENKWGLRNDIICPECGVLDTYTDDEAGAAESIAAETAYENELIALGDDDEI